MNDPNYNNEAVDHLIREMNQEVKSLRLALYGDSNIHQKGVYARIDHLEECLMSLQWVVEREKVSQSTFEALEEKLEKLSLNYQLTIVYLRGIAATLGTITVALIVAAVVGTLRFLGGA